jgi:hypothetical protein
MRAILCILYVRAAPLASNPYLKPNNYLTLSMDSGRQCFTTRESLIIGEMPQDIR